MNLRVIIYLAINWTIILASLSLAKYNLAFSPLAFLLISNRQFANYLVGHDGLHGSLAKNKFINDWCTYLFCLNPIFVSLKSYREKHLLHHEFLGTPIDPDRRLYDFYPVKDQKVIKEIFKYFLSGIMLRDFLIYFTPFFELNKKNFYRKDKIIDFAIYLTVSIVFSIGFINFFGIGFFLFLWLGPLLLLMPYYYFVSALQHGLIHEKNENENSRNIVGNFFLMELLLPCATNFHGVHHLYPQVPFYHLKTVFEKKSMTGESYFAAVKKLIP